MESDPTDSLEFVPREQWVHLEKTFLADWPRGIPSYNALVTQRRLSELGLDYGFKVYRPRGHFTNGMVALNKKGTLNEIIIQCPHTNTDVLTESLINTKLIDWKNRIMIPYMPDHVRHCVLKVAEHLRLNVETEDTEPNEMFLLNKNAIVETKEMPEDITFQHILDLNDINLVDSTWRNRYDGSQWFFATLARAQLGYGLYKKGELVSWVFINEVGALTHLFTLEDHRNKGYGEMLMRKMCEVHRKDNQHIFAYCRKGNSSACHLYKKLGFDKFHEVRWCFVSPQ